PNRRRPLPRSAGADAENLANPYSSCEWSTVCAPLRTTRRLGGNRAFTFLFLVRFERGAIYDGAGADENFSAELAGAALGQWVTGETGGSGTQLRRCRHV